MSSGLPPSAADLAALTRRIRSEFPDLGFSHAVRDAAGDDHFVVVLDGAWVFRFVREAPRIALFAAERGLLARIEAASPIPVPRYRFVSAAGDFGGYRRIEGVPMRPALFAALTGAEKAAILDALADFLRLVHALPPSAIAQADGTVVREWAGADWRARWLSERRPLVARVADAALLARMDRFYDDFAAAPPPPSEVVTHGDFSDDHMLLEPTTGRLTGIIDFGDACLADPAFDLTFFFAYGEAAARAVAARYDPGGEDPTLLARARRSYARFRIEQLRRAELFPGETAALLGLLPALLDKIEDRREEDPPPSIGGGGPRSGGGGGE